MAYMACHPQKVYGRSTEYGRQRQPEQSPRLQNCLRYHSEFVYLVKCDNCSKWSVFLLVSQLFWTQVRQVLRIIWIKLIVHCGNPYAQKSQDYIRCVHELFFCEMPNHDIRTQGLAFQCLRSCEAKNRDGTTATGFWLVDTLKGGSVKGKKTCTVTGRFFFRKQVSRRCWSMWLPITRFAQRWGRTSWVWLWIPHTTRFCILSLVLLDFWTINRVYCMLAWGVKGCMITLERFLKKTLVFSPMMPSSPREFWGFGGRHDMYFKLTWICINKIG